MTSVDAPNSSCPMMSDPEHFSTNKEEKIAGPGEKLVARVTNGLRDKTVEQIDTRRFAFAKTRERAVTNAFRPSRM